MTFNSHGLNHCYWIGICSDVILVIHWEHLMLMSFLNSMTFYHILIFSLNGFKTCALLTEPKRCFHSCNCKVTSQKIRCFTLLAAVIGGKSSSIANKKGIGTGKQTLRLRSKGSATMEVVSGILGFYLHLWLLCLWQQWNIMHMCFNSCTYLQAYSWQLLPVVSVHNFLIC